MSPEERQLLAGLFDRIRNSSGQTRDREAETFIADAVRAQPYAPYLLSQTVIVQDQALRAANERLSELENRVQELESQAKPSGGFLGGLFGGGSPAPSRPPPMPSAPQGGPWNAGPQGGGYGGPPPQAGGWGQPQPGQGPFGGQPQAAGGGFLKGALGAAAGVAGGVLLADSIRGLFHGGGNSLGIANGFGGGGLGGGSSTVNNYYGNTSDDGGYAPSYSSDGGGGASISDADYAQSDSGSDDDGGYA